MDVWLRDQPTAEKICQIGDLNSDPLDLDLGRVRAKVSEFVWAAHEEAKIHSEQCMIGGEENSLLNYVLTKLNRANR